MKPDIIVFMRIQYAKMWLLRDRKSKSKFEAWEDELVHQNGNRKWSLDCGFLRSPLAPHALRPASLALSIQMLSPFPLPSLVGLHLHSCCFHSGFHGFFSAGAAVLTSNWALPPSSPHHPKMRSYLIGRKSRSEPWIHFSLFFTIKSKLIGMLARSFKDGPTFPSCLVSFTFKCDAFTHWTGEGKSLLLHLHAFHFSLLAVLPCPSSASGNFLLHHDTFSDILNN